MRQVRICLSVETRTEEVYDTSLDMYRNKHELSRFMIQVRICLGVETRTEEVYDTKKSKRS